MKSFFLQLSIDPHKMKGYKALNTLLKLFQGKSLNEAIKKDSKISKSMSNLNFKKCSTSSKKDLKELPHSEPASGNSNDVKALPGNETIIEGK